MTVEATEHLVRALRDCTSSTLRRTSLTAHGMASRFEAEADRHTTWLAIASLVDVIEAEQS